MVQDAILKQINAKLDEVLRRTEGLRFTGAPDDLNKDMQFLRGFRLRSEEAGAVVRKVAYTTFCGGMLTVCWLGFKEYFKR